MIKVCVSQEKCIGCGLCESIAPKTYKLGNDGKAKVINPSGDSDKKIKEAVSSCPVGAIKAS